MPNSTNFKLNFLSVILFVASILLLSACGSSSSTDPGSSSNNTDMAITGYVIDGPISGSSVTLHRVNVDGSTGEQVAGAFVTDANGEWTGSAPASESVLVVVARGGQYTDDATGAQISLTNDDVMNSWYDPAEPAQNRVVSPITDSLWQIVQQELREGKSMADSVALAEQVAMDFWGIDPTDVVPDPTSSSAAEQRYGVLLAAFSFLIDNNAELQAEPFVSMPRFSLMRLLMNDMADGRLDGLGLDGGIILAPDGTAFPSLSIHDLSAFFNEANDYAATLQIDPVEDNPYRDFLYAGASVCPDNGVYIYGPFIEQMAVGRNIINSGSGLPGENAMYHKLLKLDADLTGTDADISVTRGYTTNGVTGESIYTDTYSVPFLRNEVNGIPDIYGGLALSFVINGSASKGSTLLSWRMETGGGAGFGIFSSHEAELAYLKNGSMYFNKRTPFAFFPGFAQPPTMAYICGSAQVGTGGTPSYPPAGQTHNDQYYVGGYVHDLNGTLVLQNNAVNNKTITSDGRFWFSSLHDDDAFYNISILTQPDGQTCSLANSAGQINGSHESSAQINCVNNPDVTYSVGGSASGVTGSVVLYNTVTAQTIHSTTINTGETSFVFTDELETANNYNVSVFSAPRGLACSVQNGNGVIASVDVTNIVVSCSALADYRVGGTVSGLSGLIELRNINGDVAIINTDGSFEFTGLMYNGDDYAVSIFSSPLAQTCSVANASGSIVDATINNVQVNCEASSILSNLTITQGSFTPNFAGNITSYQVSVSNDISSLTLTPSAEDSNAGITVNGNVVTSGNASSAIALSVGVNVIPVQVIAAGDVSTTNYTVTVTRDAPLSTDDSLSALSLSTGSITPSFNALTLAYTASVDFTTTSTVVTPTSTDGSATITVAGNITTSGNSSSPINLTEGENIVNINVLAEDGVTTRAYIITVTRQAATIFAQNAYIKASNPDAGDNFGSAVAMDGNTLVVGAVRESSNSTIINEGETDNSLTNAGAVYVFIKTDGVWSQQAYLKPDDMADQDWFGNSVDISGDTIVVGAYWSDKTGSSGTNDTTGAAYVFTRTGELWTQQQKLAPVYRIDNVTGDRFGSSVSLEGDTLAIGAPGDDNNSVIFSGTPVLSSGAVYIFKRNLGNWSLEQFLKASNITSSGNFGGSISLSGASLAVGASDNNGASGINSPIEGAVKSGAVYVFTVSNGSWTQQAYIKAVDIDATPYDGLNARQDAFASSIALSGDTLAVGAPTQDRNIDGVDDGASVDTGAVYIFNRTGSTWSQGLTLKASNIEAYDRFGISVSLDANSLVVSASVESSNATEIGGDESNNDQYGAGAVYRFIPSDGSWVQSHYVKPLNTPMVEEFGIVVQSNGTLVVGVKLEKNNTSGINSPEQNGEQGEITGAGAVYTFSE